MAPQAVRKTLLIMLGIMAAEGAPMAMTFLGSSRHGILRLYWSPEAGWLAWGAAGVVAAVYSLYAVWRLPTVRRHFFDLHPLKALTLPFALISGTMEEFWFRRLAMDWAAQDGANLVLQVVFSALTFGAVHGVWGVFAGRWRVALGATLATGVLGGLLAAVYLLGGRQVAPCVWAHLLINLAIEPWLLLGAVSGQEQNRGH